MRTGIASSATIASDCQANKREPPLGGRPLHPLELLKKHDPRRKADNFEYAKKENEIPAQPHPTENFLLRADGVLFVYGPYEIDCHAAGAIFIRVPADEIAPLLNFRRSRAQRRNHE